MIRKHAPTQHIICCLLACLPASCLAQGAQPASRPAYEAIPVWRPERVGVQETPRVDLRWLLPPVGNQGYHGSCVGWAVAYAGKSQAVAEARQWHPDSPSRIFSPAFVYNLLNGGEDRGILVLPALELMIQRGCCTLAAMPYDGNDPFSYRRSPSAAALEEAGQFRSSRYARLDFSPGAAGHEIRQALQQGHVVILVVQADPVFTSGRFAVFTRAERRQGLASSFGGMGAHALCVVGYDDTRHAFLLMNSWGNAWCQQGYAWVDYDLLTTVLPDEGEFGCEAYVLYDARRNISPTPQPRPPSPHSTPPAPRPSPRDVTLVQTDRYYGRVSGQPYWEWTVQLRGSLTTLAAIRSVTYHLHPSFSRPEIQITGTPGNGFAFTTNGWGRFPIRATIRFKDGSTKERTVDLQFRDPVRDGLTLQNTARRLGVDSSGRPVYAWTAYVDGPIEALRQVTSVRYILHPTFQPNVWDVQQDSEYGFPFSATGWGEFTLQARVTFKNGAVQDLSHPLDFSQAR